MLLWPDPHRTPSTHRTDLFLKSRDWKPLNVDILLPFALIYKVIRIVKLVKNFWSIKMVYNVYIVQPVEAKCRPRHRSPASLIKSLSAIYLGWLQEIEFENSVFYRIYSLLY